MDFSRDYWEFFSRMCGGTPLTTILIAFLYYSFITIVLVMIASVIIGILQVFGPPVLKALIAYRPLMFR